MAKKSKNQAKETEETVTNVNLDVNEETSEINAESRNSDEVSINSDKSDTVTDLVGSASEESISDVTENVIEEKPYDPMQAFFKHIQKQSQNQ